MRACAYLEMKSGHYDEARLILKESIILIHIHILIHILSTSSPFIIIYSVSYVSVQYQCGVRSLSC